MLDPKEIEIEIARLEYMESSYPNYAKLADLYTIRKEMEKPDTETTELREPAGYGHPLMPATDFVGEYGDSEFLRCVSDKKLSDIMAIMDELMGTLKTVNRRAYSYVLGRIRGL